MYRGWTAPLFDILMEGGQKTDPLQKTTFGNVNNHAKSTKRKPLQTADLLKYLSGRRKGRKVHRNVNKS